MFFFSGGEVIPGLLGSNSRSFGTLYRFHLHGQVETATQYTTVIPTALALIQGVSRL
jgi:hypothetical protein